MKDRVEDKIVSGVLWRFSERILAQGISFIVSIVLARLLVPKDYGTVSMVLIFISIADVFVTSGFSTALIQKKDATDIDFDSMFYCSLIVSVVIYVILFFTAPLIAKFYRVPKLTNVIRIFSIRIIISSYNSVQHAYVSKNMLFKKFFFSTLGGTLISAVTGIIMAFKGYGVWALVAQYMTNSVIDSIVLSFTIEWKPRLQFSLSSSKHMMNFGWKILAADLIGTFFDQLSSLLIGKIYTSSDLAYYNKGKQIPALVTDNVGSSIMNVLFPAIAKEGNDIEKVKKMIRNSVRVLSYVMFPIMIGICVVARPLTLVLLTEKWENCIVYMRLLCVSSIVLIFGNVSIQSVKAIGKSDILLKIEIIKKPVYLILLLLGARKNVFAIAVASVVYSFYAVFVNVITLKKCIAYSMRELLSDISEALMLSLMMGAVTGLILLLDFSNLITLLMQVAVGGAIYVLVSELLRINTYLYLKSYLKNKLRRNKKIENSKS